ncbi:MAG: hypothetical protein HXX09_06500 [Bacteroidetes bacterium]|nr:hypothetical protein [Bacteroidota bacterium]
MHIYKFRLIIEDQDDYFRDIEIKSTQTFEDFHNFILKVVNFDGKELASFYKSDSQWRPQTEISLVDMTDDTPSFDDEEGEVKKAPIFLMSKSILKDFIDDPHQKIIYVYDFLNLYTFYLELLKILPAEDKVVYPRCVKSQGELPAKNQPRVMASSEFEDEVNSLIVDDNTKDDDDDIASEFGGEGYDEESGETSDGFEELKF